MVCSTGLKDVIAFRIGMSLLHKLIRAGCCALLLVCSACVSPPPQINRAVIRNETGREVWNVSVTHLPTNQRGQVSRLSPHQSLDIGFSAQRLLAETAEARWEDALGLHQARANVPSPPGGNRSGAWVLEYRLLPSGDIEGALLPAEEGH